MNYNNYNHAEYIAQHSKPTRPRYVLGDWVVHLFSDKPELVTYAWLEVHGVSDEYEKWMPVKDEWCIFWDNPETIHIGKFRYFRGNDLLFPWCTENYVYRNCEPFIGRLPTICHK